MTKLDNEEPELLSHETMMKLVRKKIKKQEYLKVHQICKEYQFPTKTLKDAIHNKEIAHFKIDGTKGGVRITRKVFEKWLETRFAVKTN